MKDAELMVGKWSRVTGDERVAYRSRVMEKYAAGQSIREIAEEVGRSYGFVHRILREGDVTFRSRGNPHVAQD